MKKIPLFLICSLAISLAQARAALLHRYTFNHGTARDIAGSIDGRLIGTGAAIADGRLQLVNDPATPRERVSCLEFPLSLLPRDGASVSFAVWFAAKNIGGYARVLNFGDSEGTEGKQFIYFTPSTEEGMARVAITGSDVGAKTYIDFEALDDGRPHLVVIVVDGAARTLRVFADGREPRTAQPLGDNTLDKVRAVQNWLGRSSFAADPGLTGTIDEFRVYDHALTPEEARLLHEAGPDKVPGVRIDVTGAWDLVVETAMGPGRPVFTFKQEGEKLAGDYRGAFGEAPVTGVLRGAEINFSVTVKVGKRDHTILYTGTVDGLTMKGEVTLGTFSKGTFTGTKKAR